jgi:hypothetical protein
LLFFPVKSHCSLFSLYLSFPGLNMCILFRLLDLTVDVYLVKIQPYLIYGQ